MKLETLKSKKAIIAMIAIILLLALIIGTIICINLEKKTKEMPVSSIEAQELAEKEIDNQITEENVIEEAEENIINELATQNKDNKDTTKPKQNKNTMPYYIKVNYGAQVVTIYKKDTDGEYTVPVKAMVCSTGVATPTSGTYSIPARWEWLGLQGNVYGHYCTQIKGNILFHSVPYLRKKDPSSLEYWEYDKLGTYASAGCIRLTVIDAKWIYDNCGKGTKVEFYSSSTPGPLGKPSAKKISSYPDNLRNWDPTDCASDNPWKNAQNQNTQPSKKTEIENSTTNQINKNETSTNQVNNTTNQANNIGNEISKNETSNTANNTINQIEKTEK